MVPIWGVGHSRLYHPFCQFDLIFSFILYVKNFEYNYICTLYNSILKGSKSTGDKHYTPPPNQKENVKTTPSSNFDAEAFGDMFDLAVGCLG